MAGGGGGEGPPGGGGGTPRPTAGAAGAGKGALLASISMGEGELAPDPGRDPGKSTYTQAFQRFRVLRIEILGFSGEVVLASTPRSPPTPLEGCSNISVFWVPDLL